MTGRPSASRGGDQLARLDVLRAAEIVDQAVVVENEIQNGDKERRILRGGANRFGSEAGFGEEPAQPRRLLGEEGKRLNCHSFSHLAGGERPLCHWLNLPFRNLSSLF